MMIRQPSSDEAAFAFWRSALADKRTTRIEDVPEPGYYAFRFVKGGPLVPVAIWMERVTDPETGELTEPERVTGLVNGEARDQAWLARRWAYMRPISAEAYEQLTGGALLVEERAATHARLDLGAAPAIRPRRRT